MGSYNGGSQGRGGGYGTTRGGNVWGDPRNGMGMTGGGGYSGSGGTYYPPGGNMGGGGVYGDPRHGMGGIGAPGYGGGYPPPQTGGIDPAYTNPAGRGVQTGGIDPPFNPAGRGGMPPGVNHGDPGPGMRPPFMGQPPQQPPQQPPMGQPPQLGQYWDPNAFTNNGQRMQAFRQWVAQGKPMMQGKQYGPSGTEIDPMAGFDAQARMRGWM
jgi:hypothetical protein